MHKGGAALPNKIGVAHPAWERESPQRLKFPGPHSFRTGVHLERTPLTCNCREEHHRDMRNGRTRSAWASYNPQASLPITIQRNTAYLRSPSHSMLSTPKPPQNAWHMDLPPSPLYIPPTTLYGACADLRKLFSGFISGCHWARNVIARAHHPPLA